MSDAERADGADGFEGWDSDTAGDAYVRRFAKPPYTWQRVRRDQVAEAERRRRETASDREGSR